MLSLKQHPKLTLRLRKKKIKEIFGEIYGKGTVSL